MEGDKNGDIIHYYRARSSRVRSIRCSRSIYGYVCFATVTLIQFYKQKINLEA